MRAIRLPSDEGAADVGGDFEPRFSVKHMLKDVRIAARLAENYSLELPVTEVASDMLLTQLKEGRGDADYSSVARRYFPAAGGVVRPEPAKTPESPVPAQPVLGAKEVSLRTEVVAETKSATPPPPEATPPPAPAVEVKPIPASPEPTQSPPIKTEPVIEAKPIVPAPELRESRPIPVVQVAESKADRSAAGGERVSTKSSRAHR